ncbi:MAG: cupin domain-containing protein [Chloroflexi bacterium]|nr:cupin domain-containing protein [Chloroflexota bacterium]
MPRAIRRVVTGHTPGGRSTIVMDGPAPQVRRRSHPDAGSTVLWVTDRAPASNVDEADAAPAGVVNPVPPPSPGGTLLRIVDYVPASQAADAASDMIGVNHAPDREAKHAGFHQTHTVDYAIVLEGEIWAVLEEAETLLTAGDVLIQRATYHAWENRSDRLCRMAFILIDAEPLPTPT